MSAEKGVAPGHASLFRERGNLLNTVMLTSLASESVWKMILAILD
jgi:hypothetical protein